MNIDLSISNQIYNILPIYNQLNDENKVATYEFASNRLEEQKQENVLDFPKKKNPNCSQFGFGCQSNRTYLR